MDKKQREAVIKEYLKAPEELTLRQAAELLDYSYRHVIRIREDLEARGLLIVDEDDATTIRSLAGLSKLAGKPRVFKSLVNKICEDVGLPYQYPVADAGLDVTFRPQPEDVLSLVEPLLRSRVVSVLDKIGILNVVEFFEERQDVRMSKESRALLTTIFREELGVMPTEEQLRCVALMDKVADSKRLSGSFVIQSVAGASKTTCIRALLSYRSHTSKLAPEVLAPTHKALDSYDVGASTVASRFQKISGASVVSTDNKLVNRLAKYHLGTNDNLFADTLIVDEYSLLAEEAIDLIKSMAAKIIFVGDSEQISNCTLAGASLLCTLTEQYRFTNAKTTLQREITRLHNRKDYTAVKDLIVRSAVGTFKGLIVPVRKGTTIEHKMYYTGSFNHLKEKLQEYTGADAQIIAYANTAVEEINLLLNGGQEIKGGSKICINRDKCKVPELRKSSSTYQVIDVTDTLYRCSDNATGDLVDIPKEYAKLAYAITSTVAQGSSWRNVLGVLGTANRANMFNDIYSIVTRASESVEVIVRADVDDSYTKMFDFLDAIEGNRNDKLFISKSAIRKFSTQELGLPAEEVTKVLSSPAPKASRPSTSEPKAAAPAPTGDARYGVIVGNKKFPTAAKVTMTKAQACLKRDRLSRKHSVEVKVAENLHGGNRVVFDLDNALTVKVFAKFLDLTEAYISEDKSSAHIVFTTDEVLRTVHTRAGSDIKGDFLGNAAYQLRIEKSNKVYNGKEAIPLPLDEYHKFIALLKGDIHVEQVL